MKRKLKLLGMVFASGLVFGGGTAHAGILLSSTQTGTIVENGQDFDFDFNFTPTQNIEGGSITIATAGSSGEPGLDLSGAFPAEDENFEVLFDGISQGFFSCGGPSNNGSTAIDGATSTSINYNDCVFSLPFVLDGAALESFFADGLLTVSVYFGDDVSADWTGDTASQLDQFTVTVAFQVPEPATVGIMGLGLAGLGLLGVSRRRREKIQAA